MTMDDSPQPDKNDAPESAPTTASTEVVGEASARENVREKAAKVKASQKRKRVIQLSVIGAALIAIVVTVAIIVTSTVSGEVNKPNLKPAGLENDGILVTPAGVALPSPVGGGQVTGTQTPEVTVPTPDASSTAEPAPKRVDPVKVRVYVDYLSPGAATFQRTNAKQLARLIGDDAVSVTYHPVATMTAKSNGTRYSLRAAAAVACVATYSPDHFYAYNYELLAQQPKPDADGMTDVQLADLAAAIGAPNTDALRDCISRGTYQPWVKTVTETATTKELPGTTTPLSDVPTILVNGVPYIGALDDPAEFMQFVMAAESKAYYDDASPSPAPSPTPSESTTPSPTPSDTPAPTPAG